MRGCSISFLFSVTCCLDFQNQSAVVGLFVYCIVRLGCFMLFRCLVCFGTAVDGAQVLPKGIQFEFAQAIFVGASVVLGCHHNHSIKRIAFPIFCGSQFQGPSPRSGSIVEMMNFDVRTLVIYEEDTVGVGATSWKTSGRWERELRTKVLKLWGFMDNLFHVGEIPN